MSRSVTVGLDRTPASRAAAEWAAHEALIRKVPLHLVRVLDVDMDGDRAALERQGRLITDEVADDLAVGLPQLSTVGQVLAGRPSDVLCDISEETDLLVLGSRGLGGIAGFALGSMALATVAHATCPVVLIRSQAEEANGEDRLSPYAAAEARPPVVLGLDLGRPCDELLEFAFQSAARYGVPLRVLHAWQLPPVFGAAPTYPVGTEITEDLQNRTNMELREALRPWHDKFPEVRLTHRAILCRPSEMLLEAASEASLLVIGRRTRQARAGTHLGHVAHAAIHHVKTPLAVVAHE
ncbi:Nucleotide-binding universal stress protein, UspA family [Streptomyces sp. WMMB 714]|uniref:universal stress protein n=1 Tax=Streptomyces sp. WMMB 714 TaxID=1286822 RepID=UPI0005F8587B|nr:universal stress protein [Streptomyces sp. WMMB 714]SCK11386.1 Nucleotide-binding universal stress protein, UspA family [Streptomyces sp. WMMB 714]